MANVFDNNKIILNVHYLGPDRPKLLPPVHIYVLPTDIPAKKTEQKYSPFKTDTLSLRYTYL